MFLTKKNFSVFIWLGRFQGRNARSVVMIAIRSEQGYPQDGQPLARVDYYIDSPSEGVILLIGKDGRGKEYRAKKSFVSGYKYPSGKQCDLSGRDQKNTTRLCSLRFN